MYPLAPDPIKPLNAEMNPPGASFDALKESRFRDDDAGLSGHLRQGPFGLAAIRSFFLEKFDDPAPKVSFQARIVFVKFSCLRILSTDNLGITAPHGTNSLAHLFNELGAGLTEPRLGQFFLLP